MIFERSSCPKFSSESLPEVFMAKLLIQGIHKQIQGGPDRLKATLAGFELTSITRAKVQFQLQQADEVRFQSVFIKDIGATFIFFGALANQVGNLRGNFRVLILGVSEHFEVITDLF